MFDWYTFEVHGERFAARLTQSDAEALQARGLEIEPAEAPADLSERVGRALANLCRIAAGGSGGDRDEV